MMNANNTKLIKHNQEAILKKKRNINLKVNMYKLKIQVLCAAKVV